MKNLTNEQEVHDKWNVKMWKKFVLTKGLYVPRNRTSLDNKWNYLRYG